MKGELGKERRRLRELETRVVVGQRLPSTKSFYYVKSARSRVIKSQEDNRERGGRIGAISHYRKKRFVCYIPSTMMSKDPIVVTHAASGATFTINPFGAHITSWTNSDGRSLLFLSRGELIICYRSTRFVLSILSFYL